MGRQVVAKRDLESIRSRENLTRGQDIAGQTATSGAAAKADPYTTRLMKYVPSEVITAYVTVEAAIKSAKATNLSLYWAVFLVLLVATPLYLWRVTKVTKGKQLAISTVAFAVWVFALGGPFARLDWYNPIYGAVVLPLYTTLIAIVEA